MRSKTNPSSLLSSTKLFMHISKDPQLHEFTELSCECRKQIRMLYPHQIYFLLMK